MSESSPSNLAWPMHPPGQHRSPYNCARPQACDRKIASIRALRYCMRPQAFSPQAHIQIEAASIYTDSGRKHPRSHNRPRITRPSTHAQPRTGTQGERAWVRGEEGSNPPVHREKEGEGAILPPYMHPIPPLL